ncbi:MAG: molybdopterin molybdotransferase MoeA [Deltaproteobacteria bacterium]|nr:molybdopterin molybdotransferase MoeA [Deltaproteobacteria bacterium]
MLAVADAQTRISALVPRLPIEEVALDRADGRFLAASVIAARPLPGCDASAMDGFAVRAAELPGTLPVVAMIGAGDRPAPLAPGTAARIMTGAPMPVGADTVVIFEDARDHGERVDLPSASVGDNVRRTGEDIMPGDRVLTAGLRLGAGELGLLAALGWATVPVARAPVVAILATGDELVSVTDTPGLGQVVDSSAYALAAQIREAGGEPRYLGIARDDRAQVTALVAQALACDALVTTGGVSAGDRDFVRGALTDAGVALEFWKVAMKPGKPLAFGLGDGGRVPVFALPGNPVSSMVAFELFARPALRAMLGATVQARPRVPVILAGAYRKSAGRAHFLRARLERDGATLRAVPHRHQGSHALSSMIGVDALVEIPAETTDVADGGAVTALLLEPR